MHKLKIVLLLLFLMPFSLWAENLKVRLEPANPIMNETFNLIFRIETESDGQPYISFDPGGIKVIGREQRGVSRRVTIINGKMTSSREITYVYELISERSGTQTIKDISVEVGGTTLKAANKRINIYAKAKQAKNIFLLAEVSKKKVYIGEGIDLRYYLYYRIPVIQGRVETVAFPKLNKFLKRFHTINRPAETVEYNGTVYKRELSYSARLYPEKVGKATIDTLKLRVPYSKSQSPFSRFGFSFNQIRTKTVQNKKVKIEVLPLPAENVPPNFTGLIGDHDIKIILNKNRYLVNEAMEFKFEIQGPGALENYDAPRFYINENLEEFDTKSDLAAINQFKGRKSFDYTFLARGALNIEERELELWFFDPEGKRYFSKILVLPSLSVSGGNGKITQNYQKNNSDSDAAQVESSPGNIGQNVEKTPVVTPQKFIAPIFTPQLSKLELPWISYLNNLLGLLLIFLLGEQLYYLYFRKQRNDAYGMLVSGFKADNWEYSNVFHLLHPLKGEEERLEDSIRNSPLSENAKKYFLKILKVSEQKSYKGKEAKKSPKFNKDYFGELKKVLDKDENYRQY
ncbi:MAG: hypothetical protein HN509_00285 [Halobacteriovoraceae bacterium]|nr:hypothetical protein [Halobacteriovoraceae bacterium]MBT5093495.1 hypothetical protein [Halobacteriovoraceae bacterium]